MILFYWLRIKVKLFLRKYGLREVQFCKRCGRDAENFTIDDEIWETVEPLIKYGYILCYDCFCKLCSKVGLPQYWELIKIKNIKGGEECQ